MVAFRPVNGIGDQKALNLVFTYIKESTPPFTNLRTVITMTLIQWLTIKLIQPVSINRETKR